MRDKQSKNDVALLNGPVRTCVSCRKKDIASNLNRLARRKDGEVVVDNNRVLPGRGVNVCKSNRCLLKALEGKFLVRGFKNDIVLDKRILESAVF